MTDLTPILRQVGTTIYDVFVWPGDFVLSQFAALAPAVAAKLGLVGNDQSDILPVVVALLFWFLLAVVVMKILRLWQNFVRIVSAIIRTISFRISLATRNPRMRMMCRLRRLIPRRSNGADAVPEVEFNDLDLAVLKFTAAHGPAFTTSVPDLADQFPLRPAQIQRSLDKLSSNQMLDHATGSTDGFDNYRLSESGAFFMRMWQRKERGSSQAFREKE